ncbi:M56 family metallopeptidase [Curtobacterium sp. Csp1]|uniref:M56 family metallopeptidase n=1 Tax=Curtobacterium citreum TaxID=2036 RepID=A0ABT2HF11_9MICO|nr:MULTISPECIES: M56 family metallopeptidase [Curtobacterium]MCS6521810.1 M56 family metallopeptidase [Curtobacterium citreum]QKS12223.1 M56 family metallopeptidase [Curtobacterium sp. csp3]QKS19806.1 M56 family metallopeptidase [Curtobacterium sp. Csp1]RDI02275.1 peptidase M48-like protein [Curtobacterium sp. AG1037]TQJ27200.1 peptidase M48-like protein [Curtobacterium citreum]
MVVAGVALIALALVVVVVAPRVLTRSAWTIDHPRTALVSWSVAVLLGVVGFVVGIALVVLTDRPLTDPLRLGDSPTHGLNLGVALLGVLAFVVAVRVRPGAEHEAVRDAIRSGAAPQREIVGTRVALVEADHALACAVPGRSGGVLVSTGLADLLRTDELEAVVAHERAHLTQHHAWAVAVAESIERAVPWVPGARAMARSTRVLVEFAADDAAARRVGRDALRRAVLVADGTSALGAIRASRLG